MVSMERWSAMSAQIAALQAERRAPRRAWHAIGPLPACIFLTGLTVAIAAFAAFGVSLAWGG